MIEDDQEWLRWIADVLVPVPRRGKWCTVRVRLRGAGRLPSGTLMVTFNQAGPRHRQDWIVLRGAAGAPVHENLIHVPADAQSLRVGLLGNTEPTTQAEISFVPMGQAMAAFRLALRHRAALLRRVRQSGLQGLHNIRATFSRLATEPDAAEEYRLWTGLFELPPQTPAPDAPKLAALVFQPPGGPPAAMQATLAALAQQHPAMPHAIVAGGNWRDALAGLECGYVAILQAGEIPHRNMSPLAAGALLRLGKPAMACADEDTLDPDGTRRDPHFKPRPNHALMLSGTLTRGLWLIRRDVLEAAPGDLAAGWAETLRLDLWLRLHEAGNADTSRLPQILAHRRIDAPAVPAAALADVVASHLRRAGLPWRAESGFPVRLHPAPDAPAPSISILVASTLDRDHAASCLPAILAGTAYPDFEMLIAVSQPRDLNPTQAALAARLQADPRVRVINMRDTDFNFSTVNNRLAAQAHGDLLCLLNDDTAPIGADWLNRLASHLADTSVGAVGARLLYPNGTVQHGGIVMGLGGLCNHAHRYLPADQPGYAGRAVLAQEVSAVTGACLLVRGSAFHAVGGLDEAYAAAFNDVDFCLRLREAGHAVVYDGATTLHHLENTTYGTAGATASALPDGPEGRRMAHRWAAICRADPFHNPNLDLAPGREWQLAWPPRDRDNG